MSRAQVAPPADQPSFWAQVRLNVVSWLIIVGVGGVVYISYTVPRLLQMVLTSQEEIQQDMRTMQQQLVAHERRITVLELKK